MFEGAGVDLPGPTLFLLAVSNGIRKYWYLIILIIIAFVYLIRRYIKTEEGRKKFDEITLRVPIVKNLVVKVATSRFTRTMSTLFQWIPLLPAIDIVSKS